MAPKKNATKNDIVPKGRPPKSKEKPILKIPTVVKIKFPLKNLSRIVQNVKSPNPDLLNKRAKDLTPNDKLELTNRVARAQLSKSDCIVFMPQPETGNEIRSVVKKRGKKKKVEEEASTSTKACTNHEPESLEPICINKEGNLQTPKRKRVRKTLIKPVNKVPANEENNMTEEIDTNPTAKVSRAPLKRKLVNPKDGNKNPPKKKWMQTKIPEMKILVRRNSKVNSDMSRTVTIEKPKIVRRQGRPEREIPKETGARFLLAYKYSYDCRLKIIMFPLSVLIRRFLLSFMLIWSTIFIVRSGVQNISFTKAK